MLAALPASGLSLSDFDSTAIRGNSKLLGERLAADSFLLFRQLLPSSEVLAVRSELLRRLAAVGWLAPGSDPQDAVPGPTIHHDRGRRAGRPVRDPQWPVGYRAVQAAEAMHALAHHPRITELVSALLGEPVTVHPRKIARISFPGAGLPTPPHQDVTFNKTTDVLTCWIPLGDCDEAMGALRLLRGSACLGQLAAAEGDGIGGECVDADVTGLPWVTGAYRAGDVVLFHGLTVHWAPANRSDRLRLSVDCRYQAANDPVKPTALLPHGFGAGVLPSWTELTGGWRTTRWVEVAHPITVATVASTWPEPSALIPARAGRRR